MPVYRYLRGFVWDAWKGRIWAIFCQLANCLSHLDYVFFAAYCDVGYTSPHNVLHNVVVCVEL